MAGGARGVEITVKIFPASLGGPGYLRSLRGPFPDVPFLPTGGVTATNLGEWFAAGAIAGRAGGELCPTSAMAQGRWNDVETRARQFIAALASVPGDPE